MAEFSNHVLQQCKGLQSRPPLGLLFTLIFSPQVITIWYRPPEILMGSKTYSAAVDIWWGIKYSRMIQQNLYSQSWNLSILHTHNLPCVCVCRSLGCVFLEMVTGRPPLMGTGVSKSYSVCRESILHSASGSFFCIGLGSAAQNTPNIWRAF